MNNNVELCSDCFTVRLISVALTAGRKHRKIYISILSRAVISLGNYTC